MSFPYQHYETLVEPQTIYYPMGAETHARWIAQTLQKAATSLSQLLNTPVPQLQILLVDPDDWSDAPHEDEEELEFAHPYWTDTTSPPTLVIPQELDPIFGETSQEKLAYMLYHELALAFLENDPRPYPAEYPLWADEWQLKFAALWLSHQLDGVQGLVNNDLRQQYAEIFVPEPDSKTPVTVRSFDWFEDTNPLDYLCYELLLEQFAADMLASYDPGVLPRFLSLYRTEAATLLSDDITAMLGQALGPDSIDWLENLTYF